jgi:hypothetical protein
VTFGRAGVGIQHVMHASSILLVNIHRFVASIKPMGTSFTSESSGNQYWQHTANYHKFFGQHWRHFRTISLSSSLYGLASHCYNLFRCERGNSSKGWTPRSTLSMPDNLVLI